MGWLWKMFGAALAVLLASLLLLMTLVVLASHTGVGARWVSERILKVVVDSDLEVRGAAEVGWWPVLSIRAHDLVVASELSQVSPACLAGNPKEDPAHLTMGTMTLLLDWQGLLHQQVEVPMVSVSDMTVILGLDGAEGYTAAASPRTLNWRKRLFDPISGEWGAGWQARIDAVDIKKLQVMQCSNAQGIKTLYTLDQGRFSMQAESSADAGLRFEYLLDGLDLHVNTMSSGVANWLQQNGFVRDGRLVVETLRSRWRLEGHQATMESLLLVGQGPMVELVSGVLDLEQKTLDVSLIVQSVGAGTVLRVPGVEVILRKSTLPVRIYGDWSAPTIQMGQDS